MRITNITLKSIFAIIPILLLGISWLLEMVKVDRTIVFTLEIGSIASMFVLFGIGWVKNFPKWTIHAIGFCFLFSIYAMNATVAKLNGGHLLGLYALLPLVVTLLISLFLHFSLEPVKQLYNSILKEWNVLIFMFYGFLPMLFMFEFDEIRHMSVIPIIIILTLLTALSMIIYLNNSRKIIRTISLILGIVITNGIAIISSMYVYDHLMK